MKRFLGILAGVAFAALLAWTGVVLYKKSQD